MSMNFVNNYDSPIGKIILTSDGEYLTGLFFEKSNVSSKEKLTTYFYEELPIFIITKKWLDQYFYSGKQPEVVVPYKIESCSRFVQDVLMCISNIPYGKTMTYGEIAEIIATKYKIRKMSSQAVGHALSTNPICLIIPCHRVVGKHSIGGYNSGLDNKNYLLSMEKAKINYES